MTFYFKPPRGNISLHKLEECIHERLKYLKYVETAGDISVCPEDTSFKFEYLTDGSALDRTGHFMLRLISLKYNDLRDFILRGERLLFEKRLMCSSALQIKSELRTAIRHVREVSVNASPLPMYSSFICDFECACSKMMMESFLEHSFLPNHSHECRHFSITVPFTLCLDLVVSRTVDLVKGFAIVPCGKWSQLLSCLFFEHMKQGLAQLNSSTSFKSAWFDDRVNSIARSLKGSFGRTVAPLKSSSDLSSQNIDDKSVYFPPCMSNLHQTLRHRHRLTHNSRFYYSLFLKDIGMSLVNSIEFWSREYKLPNSTCASCSHSWQKDERKYIYSIRHMYGLEGSRRGYYSHHCKQLQSLNLGPLSEGGCPFVHFDKKKLISTLHKRVTSDKKATQAILTNSEYGASQACHFYHEILKSVMSDGNIDFIGSKEKKDVFHSPAQFYVSLHC